MHRCRLHGEVDPGLFDARMVSQRLLDPPRARGAGHAFDVEGLLPDVLLGLSHAQIIYPRGVYGNSYLRGSMASASASYDPARPPSGRAKIRCVAPASIACAMRARTVSGPPTMNWAGSRSPSRSCASASDSPRMTCPAHEISNGRAPATDRTLRASE